MQPLQLPSRHFAAHATRAVGPYPLPSQTPLQVWFPWHAALLLAATVAWALAQQHACPVVRPAEWLPGCVVISTFKVLCCQLVLPCVAVYYSELGERRLWVNTAWQGHQHED